MAKNGNQPTTHSQALSNQTQLLHHDYVAPLGFEAPQGATHKASTVFFPTVAAMRERQWKDKSSYTYGLHGTPTSYTLEEKLATLEGAEQCILVPSGLSAISLVFASLLQAGDEILIPDNVYGPAKDLICGEFVTWGIKHVFYDPLDPGDVEKKITPATKLLWVEAPGSVTLEFPDLPALVRLAKAHGIFVALDNTWSAGIAFCAFNFRAGYDTDETLSVDISLEALTKYHSGGGDILMGAVLTRNKTLHHRIKLTHMRFGLGVGMDDVNGIAHSLPTMRLRYETQHSVALQLAKWAASRKEFSQVLHPALDGSPGHANWQLITHDHGGLAGCLFSVIFNDRYHQRQVDAFCDALHLFRLGYSWAGPISLVVPYTLEKMRSIPSPHLKKGCLVRFAIGLESTQDLQRDLEQGLTHLASL